MKDGAHQPRYILVVVADLNFKVYGQHLRMCELKQIAEAVGAELIERARGPKHQHGDDEDDH